MMQVLLLRLRNFAAATTPAAEHVSRFGKSLEGNDANESVARWYSFVKVRYGRPVNSKIATDDDDDGWCMVVGSIFISFLGFFFTFTGKMW